VIVAIVSVVAIFISPKEFWEEYLQNICNTVDP